MKVGDKVTYAFYLKYREGPPTGKERGEIGIVKEIVDDEYAFVVYHCNGDWGNYRDYTAARTKIKDLVPGWNP